MEGLFEQLRERLSQRASRQVGAEGSALRESAVLVPLFLRDGAPHVLFTKRPETLRQHAGQISFPGGRREPADATPLDTALREAEEEIGLPPSSVSLLGTLDEIPTVTRFRIQPFVAVIPHDLVYRPSPEEIDAILEIPLATLLQPARLRVETYLVNGEPHPVYFFDCGAHVVWGATARILKNLFDVAEGLPEFEALRGR